MRPVAILLAALALLSVVITGCGSSRKPCNEPVKTLGGR
jgi:predicted component of type VI protein secretion system